MYTEVSSISNFSETLEEDKKKTDVHLKEVTVERDSLTKNLAEALQSLKQVTNFYYHFAILVLIRKFYCRLVQHVTFICQ